jgi:hypothetical protein
MATTTTGFQRQQSTPRIPDLFIQVNHFHSQTTIAQLQHSHPSSDPTGDGLYDWKDPELTLFTRDMTPEILAMGPVVVIRRLSLHANNMYKGSIKVRGAKRHATPGNSKNNGLNYHGGASNTTRDGSAIPEIDNHTVINNPGIVGYNHLYFDDYKLPVRRFVKDVIVGGKYGDLLNRAVLEQTFDSEIRYSRRRSNRSNNVLKFELVLAVPNPNWTATNHQNKWMYGRGQTVLVEPRVQTFNDGGGNLEYCIGWMARVVN